MEEEFLNRLARLHCLLHVAYYIHRAKQMLNEGGGMFDWRVENRLNDALRSVNYHMQFALKDAGYKRFKGMCDYNVVISYMYLFHSWLYRDGLEVEPDADEEITYDDLPYDLFDDPTFDPDEFFRDICRNIKDVPVLQRISCTPPKMKPKEQG